jgi:tripartite ATP-independent transporter DctP family solute receptor
MPMKRRGNLLVFLLVVLLTFGLGCGSKNNQNVVLKLGHGLDVNHPVHKAMEFMADKVMEKSGGTLSILIYPNEQLGSERECLEQLQMGSLAMTKTSAGLVESFVPVVKVFGLPYLFRDSEHMWKVLNGQIGKNLLDAGLDKGLKGLCFYDAGARSFYTTNKPIHTPDDLKGLKIRVMKSEMGVKMIDSMKGSATPIDWGELYTSLQQGVVDGAENNPPSFVSARHYEVCKYYSLNEHLRLPDMLLISVSVWNKLSPIHKEILSGAVEESVLFQRELWKKMEDESLATVKKAGVEVIYPDKELFKTKVKSLWVDFEGTEIGKLAKQIQEVQ